MTDKKATQDEQSPTAPADEPAKAPAPARTRSGLAVGELNPLPATVTVQSVKDRPETLAEVAARVGITDPDPDRADPAAALFEANRGLIGSDPANAKAGMVLVVPA